MFQVTRDQNHRCSQFWKCQKYSRYTVDWLPALISHEWWYFDDLVAQYFNTQIFLAFIESHYFILHPFHPLVFYPLFTQEFRLIANFTKASLSPSGTVTLIFLPIILRTHFLSRYQINNYFNKAVKFTETHVCTHEECNFRFEWNPRMANVITAALKWRIIKVKSNNRVKSVLDF